jgi:hypothetical protein
MLVLAVAVVSKVMGPAGAVVASDMTGVYEAMLRSLHRATGSSTSGQRDPCLSKDL